MQKTKNYNKLNIFLHCLALIRGQAAERTYIAEYTCDENGIKTSVKAEGKTTYFIYEGNTLLGQYTDNDGTIENAMQFLYDENGEIQGVQHNGRMYYYQKDIMGNVYTIRNASGSSSGAYKYEAYGHNFFGYDGNDPFRNINPIKYRGYYYDSYYGGYYNLSRYYNPGMGRFLNLDDPMIALQSKSDPDGMNLYTYCNNDPVNKFDPTGYWGGDIHYGRSHKDGGNYDGTYEWAILVGFKSDYALKIAEGDLDVDTNKNTTSNPLRAIGSDSGLADRQKYHFNRNDSDKNDSRIEQGVKFYKTALYKFNITIKKYNSELKKLKKIRSKMKTKEYKVALSRLQKTRKGGLKSACFILGKALHCYQDIFAHGNITAGPATGKYSWRLVGHVGITGVDNPYYNWKNSGKTKVVKLTKLSKRYYDTQDKTFSILLDFLEDVNYSKLVMR